MSTPEESLTAPGPLEKALADLATKPGQKVKQQKASVIFTDTSEGGFTCEVVYEPPLDPKTKAALESRACQAAAQILEAVHEAVDPAPEPSRIIV